jgi:hypothetical protein
MMRRNIELTQEQAQILYKEGDKLIKELMLKSFSQEELLPPAKPKSWKDLGEINGAYVDEYSKIQEDHGFFTSDGTNHNIFPKKEQAQALLALAQLLQLMRHPYWNGDWKPDWSSNEQKHCIRYKSNYLEVSVQFNVSYLLAFKTEEVAVEFLESYFDLLEQARPLM